MARENRIVADGHERHLTNSQYREACAKIEAEVAEQFASGLSRAGGVGRLLIRFQMRREVRARKQTLAPPDALYSSSR